MTEQHIYIYSVCMYIYIYIRLFNHILLNTSRIVAVAVCRTVCIQLDTNQNQLCLATPWRNGSLSQSHSIPEFIFPVQSISLIVCQPFWQDKKRAEPEQSVKSCSLSLSIASYVSFSLSLLQSSCWPSHRARQNKVLNFRIFIFPHLYIYFC